MPYIGKSANCTFTKKRFYGRKINEERYHSNSKITLDLFTVGTSVSHLHRSKLYSNCFLEKATNFLLRSQIFQLQNFTGATVVVSAK